MRKRDSLLHLLMNLGIQDSHPELMQRLAMEDVVIPNFKHSVELVKMTRALEQEGKLEAQRTAEESTATEPNEKPRTPNPINKRSSWLNDLLSPNRLLQARYKKALLASLNQPADFFANRFSGLTELETGFAIEECGVGARVAGKGDHEELGKWVADVCSTEGIPRPKLVIVNSDIPGASAVAVPGEQPAVFVTTNLMEILNPRQLRAMIAHELGHLKEDHNKGVMSVISHRIINRFRGNQPRRQEEYRADAFSKRITGSPGDMVDALRIMAERLMEIKHFSKQAISLCDGFDLNLDLVFPVALRRMADEKIEIFDKDVDQRSSHPSYVSRFDALFADDSTAKTKKPER